MFLYKFLALAAEAMPSEGSKPYKFWKPFSYKNSPTKPVPQATSKIDAFLFSNKLFNSFAAIKGPL